MRLSLIKSGSRVNIKYEMNGFAISRSGSVWRPRGGRLDLVTLVPDRGDCLYLTEVHTPHGYKTFLLGSGSQLIELDHVS